LAAEVAMPEEETITPKCSGLRKDGAPCNIEPELLHQDEDGLWWCWNHDPDPTIAAERETGRVRGGAALARKYRKHQYLDADELGRLESPADVLRIAAAVTFAVATGRLSSSAGSVVLRALQEWRQAHEAVDVLAEVRRMKAMVEAMRRDNGGRTR